MTGDSAVIGPLLSVRGLAVHFPLKRRGLLGPRRYLKALDGVDFDLGPGETLGIVGESGCGKSTLCRAVLRLIEPTAGRAVFLGRDLRGLAAEELRRQRRQMQIVFQDPLASLDPRMTARQTIERPLLNFADAPPPPARKAMVAEMMQRVGLDPATMDRYPHQFSGGQCQRIGIARALILKPKLIVCDEPVSALDVSVQAQIVNLLTDLQRDLGLSYLFISHNLSIVRQISHRVLVLYLGKAVEAAPRAGFFRRPLHPYSQALIAAVPEPDPRRERAKPPLGIEGDLPSPMNPPSGCRFRTRCPRATELCAAVEPPLLDYGDGHFAACHHTGATPA